MALGMVRRIGKSLWRNAARFLRDPELRTALVWWLVLSTLCFGVSAAAVAIRAGHIASLASSVPLYAVCIANSLGMLVGMFLWHWYKWQHYERRPCDNVLAVFFSKTTGRDSLTAAILTLLATILCLILVSFAYGAAGLKDELFLRLLIDNPGGLFALLTGTGTLVGTYVAVQSILEMKHTIVSFAQLVDRVTSLIEEAQGSAEGVVFLAYTIQPGAFNIDTGLSERLRQALRNPHTKIRVVCLSQEEHNKWLKLFENAGTAEKGTIEAGRLEAFDAECEDILRVVGGHSHQVRKSPVLTESWTKEEMYRATPVRLNWTEMPGYYFFVSAQRAILAVPIGMPRCYNPAPGRGGVISVETLGFETSDRRIVQMLGREFERYTGPVLAGAAHPVDTKPSTPPAQVIPAVGQTA